MLLWLSSISVLHPNTRHPKHSFLKEKARSTYFGFKAGQVVEPWRKKIISHSSILPGSRIDTSVVPVNHCSQSPHSTLSIEKSVELARTGQWRCKQNTTWTVLNTPLLMAQEKQGAHHCCFGQYRSDELCPEKCKEILFSYFPSLNKDWRTAKPGSEHVVDPMIRPSICTHGLPLLGKEGGAIAAQAWP